MAALVLFLVTLITTSCCWHLRNSMQVPEQLRVMVLDSSDFNSPLINAIRNKMRIHGIELIKKYSLNRNIPSLSIIKSTINQDTASIFQDGRTAEYQMTMSVIFHILTPGPNIYPISVKVYRSFFDNQHMALAKNVEQHLIIDEMYDMVAEELISRLSNIHIVNPRIIMPQ